MTILQHIIIALITIPFSILLNSFVEWYVHGPMMHGKLGKIVGLREGHEEHHEWFGKKEGFANENHGKSVALALWTFFALGAFMALVGGILVYITGYGIIMVYVMVIYVAHYVLYQYIHTSMHIPKGRWIEKTHWFKRRNAYHRAHHAVDEDFEKFVNICILCNWADRLFGTYFRRK